MEKIVEFLTNYWEFICIALVILVNTILLLFRRNKTYDNSIYSDLIPLILIAESTLETGNDRLKYVLTYFPYENHPSTDKSDVKRLVEYILSLPTKKGGFGREKDV